jgi:hypothetical protein
MIMAAKPTGLWGGKEKKNKKKKTKSFPLIFVRRKIEARGSAKKAIGRQA